jgi:hypothetical protein
MARLPIIKFEIPSAARYHAPLFAVEEKGGLIDP